MSEAALMWEPSGETTPMDKFMSQVNEKFGLTLSELARVRFSALFALLWLQPSCRILTWACIMILSPVDGTESPYSLGAAGVVAPALQLLLCLSLQLIVFALFELVCMYTVTYCVCLHVIVTVYLYVQYHIPVFNYIVLQICCMLLITDNIC